MTTHMLTFDVEEFFQVQAAAGSVPRTMWHVMQKRLGDSMELILETLHENNTKATFFVLGWVAKFEKHLVRDIADHGHEIASHGLEHRMINHLSRKQFVKDITYSKKLIEDVSGRRVWGYRAPTFSLTLKTAWAIDELQKAGFIYDSSVFPIYHDRYGVPGAPTLSHTAVGPEGGEIIEIPPLTFKVFAFNIPIGGGGYFRLAPQWLIDFALKRATKNNVPAMLYLHPWEFDPDQPVLEMGKISKWRHRVNINKTACKLEKILKNFKFAPVSENLELIDKKNTARFMYRAA